MGDVGRNGDGCDHHDARTVRRLVEGDLIRVGTLSHLYGDNKPVIIMAKDASAPGRRRAFSGHNGAL